MNNNNNKLINSNIGFEFINFFYNCWVNDTNILLENNIIQDYTKFVFNSYIYKGVEIINLLNLIKNNNIFFNDYKYEILDSNSRQINILINGKINNIHNFSQTFNLLLIKNKKWIIINSLLILF